MISLHQSTNFLKTPCKYFKSCVVLSNLCIAPCRRAIKLFMLSGSKTRGILILSGLSFCHSTLNFKLAYNFATLSSRALIFHISIFSDKPFAWVPTFFYAVTFTLEFGLLFENLNLAYNFSTVNVNSWIFHICILAIRSCYWYQDISDLSLQTWSSLKLAIFGSICVSQTHLVP